MKKIICLICACLMLFGLQAVAFASADYDGPVDPFSGDPTDQSQTVDEDGLIELSTEMYYDATNKRFAFPVGNTGTYVYATVPYNAAVASEVIITVPSDLESTLYKNGYLSDLGDSGVVNVPGEYVLSVADGNGGTVQPFKFTILNTVSGVLQYYRLPTGFYISEFSIDGNQVDPDDSTIVDFTAEGEYHVIYRNPKIGVQYELYITIDHTAPTLTVVGLNDKNLASNPVEITDISEEVLLSVFLNGEKLENPGLRYTKAGKYKIIATDPAGNVTSLDFSIAVYFSFSLVVFLIIVGALIAIVTVYLIIRRKKTRVR